MKIALTVFLVNAIFYLLIIHFLNSLLLPKKSVFENYKSLYLSYSIIFSFLSIPLNTYLTSTYPLELTLYMIPLCTETLTFFAIINFSKSE